MSLNESITRNGFAEFLVPDLFAHKLFVFSVVVFDIAVVVDFVLLIFIGSVVLFLLQMVFVVPDAQFF